jgi:thymidylate synthase (FAD)
MSSEATLKVTLVSHTPYPDEVIAAAAKLCYSSNPVSKIIDKIKSNKKETAEFIARLSDLHHGSPFEHVSFTFAIEGVSRALTHQLVRHRIASYSQKSQRYVTENSFEFIIPPSVERNPKAAKIYKEVMELIQEKYSSLINDYRIHKEDARMLLPNACETKIFVTMNARTLMNFFNHRCCIRAQWEIRALANEMLKLVKEVAPETFKNAGASCITYGYCPENKMSCGVFPTLEQITNKK